MNCTISWQIMCLDKTGKTQQQQQQQQQHQQRNKKHIYILSEPRVEPKNSRTAGWCY